MSTFVLQTNVDMLERFLSQTSFVSEEDYRKNFHLIEKPHFNFSYDVMDVWAAEAPDKLALLWTNDQGAEMRFTFKDIKEQSDRTAAYFQSLGIGRGDMVMLILKRHCQWWLSMLALSKIGAVAIPATHMLSRSDIVYRNRRADVKAIICVNDEYVTGHVLAAMEESPGVKVLVAVNSVSQQGKPVPEGFHNWEEEWLQAPEFKKPSEENENGDMMLIYFTSGTNGEPKMVAHNHLYALGHITTGAFWHNLNEDSLHLTVADTGWGKAVWGKLYGQWFAGATVFVFDYEKFSAPKMLDSMSRYRITSFCAPPTVYRFLIHEDFSKYDLSALKYATTAGEALEPAVYQKFLNLTGIRLMEGFGQTETTMTLGTMPWMTPKPGSMGKPNIQYDVHLLRADGSECAAGEKGEICLRIGSHQPEGLFNGYYKDEEMTAKVWHDGFYHTGDMATYDEDGYFWFIGRIDDVIKSSGYKIGPFEVESALMSHPAVLECAVTAVPDPLRGKAVKATIVLRKEWRGKQGPELAKMLQEHVKSITAPYKYPRVVEFVDELPKTVSGKIRRVEIRERDKANAGNV